MTLNLEQKKDLVKEVADVVANADTLLTADFRGLTANELGEFRKSQEIGIFIKVVKNNMLKMALKDSDYESISERVSGPQILATSSENPGDFAKLIKGFIDDHESIELKSLAYKGKELDLSEQKISITTIKRTSDCSINVSTGTYSKIINYECSSIKNGENFRCCKTI